MATRRRKVTPEENRVLALRRAGVSFHAIAADLGVTEAQAEAMFERAAEALRIPYSTKLELDRLERMHAKAWTKAQEGDLAAMDTVLKIADKRERLLRQPKTNDHELRNAFDDSIAAARKAQTITSLDDALVEAGRRIADRVDEAISNGDGMETTKALYLLPHMMNVLREALATPASRISAGVTHHDSETSKGAKLRGLRGGAAGKAG